MASDVEMVSAAVELILSVVMEMDDGYGPVLGSVVKSGMVWILGAALLQKAPPPIAPSCGWISLTIARYSQPLFWNSFICLLPWMT